MKSIIFHDKNELASAMIAGGLSNSLATYVAYMVLPEGVSLAAEFGTKPSNPDRFEIIGAQVGDKSCDRINDALDLAATRDDPHVKIVAAHRTLNKIVFLITCSIGADSPDMLEAAQYMELANKFHKE